MINTTREHVDLSEHILEDLKTKGLTGEDLLEEVKLIKSRLPEAINKLKTEASSNEKFTGDTKDFMENLLKISNF